LTQKRTRVAVVVAGMLAVAGLAGAGMRLAGSGSGGGPKTITAGGVIADRPGDAKVDEGKPDTPRGRIDITGVSAEYRPEGLALTVNVKEPIDPFADPNWSADGTWFSWEIDTTRDGKPDYEVSYYLEKGVVTGDVSTTEDLEFPMRCSITEGTYSPSAGYTAILNPSCLDNPTSIAYRVTFYYQTNPAVDDAPVLSDVAPDKGMTPMLMAPPPGAPVAATPVAKG
jgi:hypothetical protein